MRSMVAAVLLCVVSGCGVADVPEESGDELSHQEARQAGAVLVYAAPGGAGGPYGKTFAEVRSLYGEPFFREPLPGGRTRWTYFARPCQSNPTLWCLTLNPDSDSTTYQITFYDAEGVGYLSTAIPWNRIDLYFTNASDTARTCVATYSWNDTGVQRTGEFLNTKMAAGRQIGVIMVVYPGAEVWVQAYCHKPGLPGVEQSSMGQRIVVDQLRVPWHVTYPFSLPLP